MFISILIPVICKYAIIFCVGLLLKDHFKTLLITLSPKTEGQLAENTMWEKMFCVTKIIGILMMVFAVVTVLATIISYLQVSNVVDAAGPVSNGFKYNFQF